MFYFLIYFLDFKLVSLIYLFYVVSLLVSFKKNLKSCLFCFSISQTYHFHWREIHFAFEMNFDHIIFNFLKMMYWWYKNLLKVFDLHLPLLVVTDSWNSITFYESSMDFFYKLLCSFGFHRYFQSEVYLWISKVNLNFYC